MLSLMAFLGLSVRMQLVFDIYIWVKVKVAFDYLDFLKFIRELFELGCVFFIKQSWQGGLFFVFCSWGILVNFVIFDSSFLRRVR